MRRAHALIHLKNLPHNLSVLRDRLAASGAFPKIMAVIKANGYGHGAIPIAHQLSGVDAFAVASVEEGVELRLSGVVAPIIILEGFLTIKECVLAFEHGLDLVIHHMDQVEKIHDLTDSQSPSKKIRLWLKLDTGMNRLGFDINAFKQAFEQLSSNPLFEMPFKLMTHLSDADTENFSITHQQLDIFESIQKDWIGEISIANSAASLLGSEKSAWKNTLGDWTRFGVALYGVVPFADRNARDFSLKPVMQLTAPVISVKSVRAGETVGYGSTWQATKDTLLAVVAIGYADGYPRSAESGTPVEINGKQYPLVGRVSMDMITVDIGDHANNVSLGDIATLWGSETLAVECIAKHSDRIPYELLCGVTQRVNFDYIS